MTIPTQTQIHREKETNTCMHKCIEALGDTHTLE